jgi:hypothetical protein
MLADSFVSQHFLKLAGLRRTSACRGHRMAANTNMCRIRDDIC